MPVTLPALSRRRFLASSLATGAALVGRPLGLCASNAAPDPHRFALLADTHVPADRDVAARGVNMADNLAAVGRQLLALDARPSAVLVGGDCAYLTGEAEDYALLVELLAPLREVGLPVHLVLGNHDHRARFREALAIEAPKAADVDRHVAVVEAPRANWFLLDSLDETNKTPGVLGEDQLAWLTRQLDEQADRPAVVLVHHNPDEKERPTGLVDTRALLETLVPRRHVKAVFFGHTHDWNIRQRDGLHLVNLPPTAYVFAEGKPSGWTDLRLHDDGAVLELRCLDDRHRQHGERVELAWRE